VVEEGDPKPGQTWIEVSVEINGEGAEAVSELFNRYGTGGAVLLTEFDRGLKGPDDRGAVTVKTYIPAGEKGIEARRRLKEGFWHLSQIYPLPELTFRPLPCEEWATAWKKHFPILHVGQRLVIHPPWLEYHPRPDEVVIELEPGMAFGTGLHPTTRMCLLAAEELTRPGMRVLDVGTGSGILAIAAAKLGAGSVLALDIDPIAVQAAQANAAANEVADRVHVLLGSLKDIKHDLWDLIFVNILAQTIIALLEEGLATYLSPGGKLVAAGIIEGQEEEVEKAFASHKLAVSAHKRKGDWITLIGQRPPGVVTSDE